MQAMAAAAAVGPGGHIDIAIDYHCYAMEILYPAEMNPVTLPALHQQTGVMLQNLIQVHGGGGGYGLDFPINSIGYTATGSVMDHVAQQHQARAFTIELDPAPAPPGTADDVVLQMFNDNENQIQAIFEKNIRGALAAIAVPATALDTANFTVTWGWNVTGLGNALP
jgi:hypothetical protein